MKTNKVIYAEDIGHYWKTSQSSPDTWLENTKKEIRAIGGVIIGEMVGMINGKAGLMLEFKADNQHFRIIYPVLPTRKESDSIAAKRQAATAMYHEVKALCVSVKFRGITATFHNYLLLPDGRIASQLTAPEIEDLIPLAYRLPSGRE